MKDWFDFSTENIERRWFPLACAFVMGVGLATVKFDYDRAAITAQAQRAVDAARAAPPIVMMECDRPGAIAFQED